MNVNEFLNNQRRCLVVACTELLPILPGTSRSYAVPCTVLATVKEQQEVLEQAVGSNCDTIVVLGHSRCELLFKTVMGTPPERMDTQAQLQIDDIFRSVTCLGHVKPQAVLREVVVESVRQQTEALRKLAWEVNAAVRIVGAWLDADAEVCELEKQPLMK